MAVVRGKNAMLSLLLDANAKAGDNRGGEQRREMPNGGKMLKIAAFAFNTPLPDRARLLQLGHGAKHIRSPAPAVTSMERHDEVRRRRSWGCACPQDNSAFLVL